MITAGSRSLPRGLSVPRRPGWAAKSHAADGPGDALGSPVPPPHHPAGGLASGWPLRDYLELGALPGSVPCARYHARNILWEWHLDRLTESAELVVDELVNNAVSASRRLSWPSPVRMWLLSDGVSLLVSVWDAHPEPPVRVDPAGDAETGRGLLLVEAVTAWWDWHPVSDTGGKAVRALITG